MEPSASPDAAAKASRQPSRLEAMGLRKSYGSRLVVEDVSLAVQSGEVVGLLGPNGAGKTTSFYMIVGLVRADAGHISIDGQSVERLPIHQRARMGLSYLPQEASIFRKLTVEENIRAVLELQTDAAGVPLSEAEIDKRTDVLLHDLRVEHIRKSAAPALSGGERRRVEIARAFKGRLSDRLNRGVSKDLTWFVDGLGRLRVALVEKDEKRVLLHGIDGRYETEIELDDALGFTP